MEKGQKVKVRLPDNRVVDADYIKPAAFIKKSHHVCVNGKMFLAVSDKPHPAFDWQARFVWSPECKI